MAVQRAKHSDYQMRGLAEYQQMRECTHCGQKSFRVIETRQQKDARRRRYQCDLCGHRETRYELEQEIYEEFVQLRRNFKALSKIFTSHLVNETIEELAPANDEYRCLSCGFYAKSSGYCSLEIPECGTSDANDCPSYIKDK
jgi:predicted RNA-binding Zn-ribbon protein involved in translation (DUF1610 family)